MTNKVYTEILKPMNQCLITGMETIVSSERLGDFRITIYKDHYSQWRVTLKDINKDMIVSSILFDQFKTVKYKYTLPDYRGNNYTKQLFAFMEYKTKRKFKHSDNLTVAGKASIG